MAIHLLRSAFCWALTFPGYTCDEDEEHEDEVDKDDKDGEDDKDEDCNDEDANLTELLVRSRVVGFKSGGGGGSRV